MVGSYFSIFFDSFSSKAYIPILNTSFGFYSPSDSYLWTKIEPLINSHLYLSLGLAFFRFLISLLTNTAGVSVSMLRVKYFTCSNDIFIILMQCYIFHIFFICFISSCVFFYTFHYLQ